MGSELKLNRIWFISENIQAFDPKNTRIFVSIIFVIVDFTLRNLVMFFLLIYIYIYIYIYI